MTNNTFGVEKAFAAVWIEIRCAAQTGLMQMQLLLTQHFRQSSRSNRSSVQDLKLTIRCTVHSSLGKRKLVSVQEYRGTKGHHDMLK